MYYTGIVEEHLHTRSAVSLFDVSHMGEFFLRGKGASADLERLMTCRIDGMLPGRCRYGFFLSEEGGIVDDLIVFKISDEEFMLVVNAGTTEKDRNWVLSNKSHDVSFTDVSGDIAKLDVQGPASLSVLEGLAGKSAIEGLGRFCFTKVNMSGTEVILSRTGYTGETGYEIFIPWGKAPELWDIIISRDDVKPAGLGARDTLRLEMGYPLYGNDIDEEVTPFEAGLARFVDMDKDFIGKRSLNPVSGAIPGKILSGFVSEGRRAARKGFSVEISGEKAGVVTSGAFSPSLKRAVGLCYVDKRYSAEGTRIALTDGRVTVDAKLAKLPLLRK